MRRFVLHIEQISVVLFWFSNVHRWHTKNPFRCLGPCPTLRSSFVSMSLRLRFVLFVPGLPVFFFGLIRAKIASDDDVALEHVFLYRLRFSRNFVTTRYRVKSSSFRSV